MVLLQGLTFHQMVQVNSDAVLKSTLAPPPSGVSAWGSAFCSLHHHMFALKVYGCDLTVAVTIGASYVDGAAG